jgi:hypothetical protein
MTTRRETAALAAVWLLMAGLAVAACGSSVAGPAQPTATVNALVSTDATATATVAPTETATATVTPTAEPTKTKSGGSGATAGPAPKPNLMGLVPELSPAVPTCNVNFKIDFQVGNKGLGDATRATTVRIRDRAAAGGAEHDLGTMNIPALPRGTGGHYYATVTVPSYGSRLLILSIDPSNVVSESNEADNVVTKAYTVLMGYCPKP